MPRNARYTALAASALAAGAPHFSRMLAKDAYMAAKNYGTGAVRYVNKKSQTPKSFKKTARPSTYALKRHVSGFTPGIRQSNVMSKDELTRIAQGTGLQERDRQIITIRGINFTYFCSNLQLEPEYRRWAIIQFKHDIAPSVTDVETDFFRGTLGSRVRDFGDITNGQHRYTYGINTDKYIVHAQGKFVLAPVEASGKSTGNQCSYKSVEQYVPINRNVNFQNTLATDAQNSIWFVTWGNPWDSVNGTAINNGVETAMTAVIYFQD